jgi:hypothetical protein
MPNPQVSGLSARLDMSRRARERIVELRVGGEPLVAERTYRCVAEGVLLWRVCGAFRSFSWRKL